MRKILGGLATLGIVMGFCLGSGAGTAAADDQTYIGSYDSSAACEDTASGYRSADEAAYCYYIAGGPGDPAHWDLYIWSIG